MICTSWSFVCWQDISLFWCQLSGSTSPGFLWCSNPYYPTDCCSSSENRVRTLIKRNSSVGLTMNELYHSRSEFVSSKPNKTIFCPIFALFLPYFWLIIYMFCLNLINLFPALFFMSAFTIFCCYIKLPRKVDYVRWLLLTLENPIIKIIFLGSLPFHFFRSSYFF